MSDEPVPPARRATDRVEQALISERLAQVTERLDRLAQAEESERAGQGELLAISRENRDLTRELVEQGRRREEREREALDLERKRAEASDEAKHRRLDAELEERKTMRAWLRTNVGDRILVPLGVSLALAAGGLLTALVGWATGIVGGGP